jgi:hypothetical protein
VGLCSEDCKICRGQQWCVKIIAVIDIRKLFVSVSFESDDQTAQPPYGSICKVVFFVLCSFFFFFSLTVQLGIILVNNQLDALFQCIYLFHFSACFGQPSAHHQENQLYQYIIWCISVCIGDCLVCRSLRTGIPDVPC